MNYKRHIVQYNDLVFDTVDMISESAYTSSFKSFDSEYGFNHGAYSPNKSGYVLLKPKTISLTVHLFMKDIPCEYRHFYKQFAETQLAKSGKIWSVENNTLEWAYAELRGFNESAVVRKDKLEFDIDVYLPEGVWHKANKTNTFLVPFDKCEFIDCYDYKDINPCEVDNCCNCHAEPEGYCNCCDCNNVTKDMALCYQEEHGCCKGGLQFFYSCHSGYKIVYDCALGRKFFDNVYGAHWGQRICSDCGPIYGMVYSDTEIPTNGVTMYIHGKVTNPLITINGNTNMIKGEFENLLINSDMTIYKDCCDEPIDVSDLVIPKGQDIGWTIYPGNNRISIDGVCCGTVCAYVETDALTI